MNDKQTQGTLPAIGFAGLAAKVSEVEQAIAEARRLKAMPVPRAERGTAASFTSPVYDQPIRTGNVTKAAWWIGGVVVAGIIWAANQNPRASTASSEPEAFSEVAPPVGMGLTLDGDEIRYCLAEKIRMDAAQSVIDEVNWDQVDQFNAMVSDYNSRCGEFRYRQGSMSDAQRDVEAVRIDLERQGRDRILGLPR